MGVRARHSRLAHNEAQRNDPFLARLTFHRLSRRLARGMPKTHGADAAGRFRCSIRDRRLSPPRTMRRYMSGAVSCRAVAPWTRRGPALCVAPAAERGAAYCI